MYISHFKVSWGTWAMRRSFFCLSSYHMQGSGLTRPPTTTQPACQNKSKGVHISVFFSGPCTCHIIFHDAHMSPHVMLSINPCFTNEGLNRQSKTKTSATPRKYKIWPACRQTCLQNNICASSSLHCSRSIFMIHIFVKVVGIS